MSAGVIKARRGGVLKTRPAGVIKVNGRAGFSLVEALVAIALAGVAAGGLASAGVAAVRQVALARDRAVALGLLSSRLEALRAGPRDDGEDVVAGVGGSVFTRRWQTVAGRGEPDAIEARAAFGGRSVVLRSEAYP